MWEDFCHEYWLISRGKKVEKRRKAVGLASTVFFNTHPLPTAVLFSTYKTNKLLSTAAAFSLERQAFTTT